MSIPGQQCALVVILVFIIIGFQRGWKRELVSLVFVMLSTLLIRIDTSDAFGAFIGRIPALFAFLTGTQAPENTSPPTFLVGPFWSLIIFSALVGLGYYVGNKVFPKPGAPQERLIGIVPAIIAGAFIVNYMIQYFASVSPSNSNSVSLDLQATSPESYVPVIIVVIIVALVGALIAARVRKAKK